ncbi:MAG: TetR/AcrR family transcriptional regulator [Caldiserica bacterium]|jgi:AcrR family transcriptional regulator|nr:TetR/AcrR family transcriptional regulator [Caldisericota bacterium]
MSNNLSRRERKKNATRSSILRAARHLFEEKGPENTSIEEIAEMADVSKSTFFNYFPNKESLFTAIAEEEVQDILLLEEELSSEKSALKKIRAITKRILEDVIPYLHLTGKIVFTSIISTDGRPSPFLEINFLLERIVKEGQEKGEIAAIFSPTDIATAIMGCCYGLIFRWIELGYKAGSISELEKILDMLFLSIKGPHAQGSPKK